MPNASSVIASMESVAMEKEHKTYKYPVSASGIWKSQKEKSKKAPMIKGKKVF